MPLPTDPETLRIPAFMRRRSLRTRQQRKTLLLTALDRKQAGILPEEINSPKKKRRVAKIHSRSILPTQYEKRKPRAKKRRTSLSSEKFSAPLLEDVSTIYKTTSIGTITHYYDKIKVAVIALTNTLSVGDAITYETCDNNFYQQIVESMEINRSPVFKATKGQEIGIKTIKAAKIGSKVTK